MSVLVKDSRSRQEAGSRFVFGQVDRTAVPETTGGFVTRVLSHLRVVGIFLSGYRCGRVIKNGSTR